MIFHGEVHGQPQYHTGISLKAGQGRGDVDQGGQADEGDQDTRCHVDGAEYPHIPDLEARIHTECHQSAHHRRQHGQQHTGLQGGLEGLEKFPGNSVSVAENHLVHRVVQCRAGGEDRDDGQTADHPVQADDHHIGKPYQKDDHRIVVFKQAHRPPPGFSGYRGVSSILV